MTQTYEGTHLTGLDGTNPLGFFAALGVQVLFADEPDQPKLWWSNDVIPHAIVSDSYPVEKIVDQAMAVFPKWADSPTLSPTVGSQSEKATAKFSKENLRAYLESTIDTIASELAASLVAEGSYQATGEHKGKAKLTNFDFTSGPQKMLSMASKILRSVTEIDLHKGLVGEWSYQSALPSLGWDVVDDRVYALSNIKPISGNKFTNPGPEALAILGISKYPVFSGNDSKGQSRTLTSGCSGGINLGQFTWPLWNRAAGVGSVKSLLAHSSNAKDDFLSNHYSSWGISLILQSQIRRPEKYGVFGPPSIIWRH